jgi:hypothetical protein
MSILIVIITCLCSFFHRPATSQDVFVAAILVMGFITFKPRDGK